MTNSIPANCANCYFFRRGRELDRGFCYRYPPSVLGAQGGQVVAARTPVTKTDWCGEFKLKEKTDGDS